MCLGTLTTTRGSGSARGGQSLAKEIHPDWNINFCIAEPSGVKTNFETHSKAYTEPHPAYNVADMPARVLEKHVEMEKSGTLTEPTVIAEAVYDITSRGEQIPLRGLPLGGPAWNFIKVKFELGLVDLENVKESV